MSRDLDVRDLKDWTENDVYSWLREQGQPRELKGVIKDNRVDGYCILGRDSRWLDECVESLRSSRWRDREIREFEKLIEELQDEGSRGDRRSTRGRRGRTDSYDSRDDSPRDRRRRVPKTTAEDVWMELGGGKEIEKKKLREYLFMSQSLPLPPAAAARDLMFAKLDPDSTNYITEKDFFGLFPKDHSFKKSLREAYNETGLGKKKKRRAPDEDIYTFDDKIQGDELLKYVEYACGKRYVRYATEFVRDGRTAIDLQTCPNHVFAAVIQSESDQQKVMNAFRMPEKRDVDDVLNDLKRKERKKKQAKAPPCPKNPEELWDEMDSKRRHYIKEGNFLKVLEKYCRWISTDDALEVFQYIEDRDHQGRVYEREFLDHFFKSDDFESDLERLVKKTRGKSQRKIKYLGKDVIRKIWKYSDHRDQRVYSRDFKDFLEKKLGINRTDARLVWKFITTKEKQERMELEAFHHWFPRNDSFKDAFENVFRETLREARNSKNKQYIDFATLHDDQLREWLIALDLKKYYRVFQRYRIRAKDLYEMRVDDLDDIIQYRDDAYLIIDEMQNQEFLRQVFKNDPTLNKNARASRSRSRKRSDSLDSRNSRDGSRGRRGGSPGPRRRSRSRRGGSRDRGTTRGGDREDDRRGRRRDRSGSRDSRRGRSRRGRDASYDDAGRSRGRDRRSSDDWSTQNNADEEADDRSGGRRGGRDERQRSRDSRRR